jgi:branched-chain amino acid transport system ATP-binding protein
MATLLEIKELTKSFGELRAVDNVNLSVEGGELRAIIGPNGAGKTTFFNLISGRIPADSGQILFRGNNITSLPIHKILRAGISRSFQITNIFPKLTVFENVLIPVLSRMGKSLNFLSSAKKISGVNEETLSVLESIGLSDKSNLLATALSHGDQKRLEMAVALANRPTLMLLDEPTAGMSPEDTAQTVELIKKVCKELAITIIFTEHDMGIVFSISDRISVLQQGRIIAEGKPQDIRYNERVIEAYLGEAP